MINLEKDKKKAGKLATYVTILLLMVIIVIIIAAMADDREKTFQTKIDETTQTNLSFQDEIVAVKDENYKLNKQVADLEKAVADNSAILETNKMLNEVWSLLKSSDKYAAEEKFNEIDASTIPEASKAFYEAVKEAINN